MTLITDMDLPDSVSNAARDAFDKLDGPLLYGYKAAIRAALQAMIDCGIAIIEDREDWENSLQSIKRSTFLVIKLRP